MCGKFTIMMTWAEYCALAGVGTDGGAGGPDAMDAAKVLQTMTPMATVPVLHLGPVRQRRITPMRWGWYDQKLADPRKGFRWLHARSDTIDSTPAWIEPFYMTRGVVFTKQFNIGEELPNGKIKQWVCNRADKEHVAIAVLYSVWDLVGGPLRTFAMVTTDSVAPLNERDSRMPAILANEDEIAIWLGETGADGAELKALLRPYEGELVMREQDGPKKDGPPPKPKKAKPEPQPGLF